jgi:hypothetical protein
MQVQPADQENTYDTLLPVKTKVREHPSFAHGYRYVSMVTVMLIHPTDEKETTLRVAFT